MFMVHHIYEAHCYQQLHGCCMELIKTQLQFWLCTEENVIHIANHQNFINDSTFMNIKLGKNILFLTMRPYRVDAAKPFMHK